MQAKIELIQRKGVYPYKYMVGWERFEETNLPPKEAFWSELQGEGISDEEYNLAQAIWKAFGCKTLGDYHEGYLQPNVELLADVFESFERCFRRSTAWTRRTTTVTMPGSAWGALLKK